MVVVDDADDVVAPAAFCSAARPKSAPVANPRRIPVIVYYYYCCYFLFFSSIIVKRQEYITRVGWKSELCREFSFSSRGCLHTQKFVIFENSPFERDYVNRVIRITTRSHG